MCCFQLVDGLKETNQYNRTVIIFMSDNGGRYITGANKTSNPNYPLRGYKSTVYEGGTRVPGLVHAPGLLPATGGNRWACWTNTHSSPVMPCQVRGSVAHH